MDLAWIESVGAPLADRPELALSAARLLARAELLGVGAAGRTKVLDGAAVRAVADELADRGVATGTRLLLAERPSPEDFERFIARVLEATEHSPMPDSEWRPVLDALGDDLVADLVGASPASLRRYASGQRPTPDAVAGRLHFVALLVADLAGAYNDYGLRRWFNRPRAALGDRTPRAVMGPSFDPDGVDAATLRALVDGLVGAGAA